MTASQDPRTQTFQITGMDCADCARTIERGVGRLDGVDKLTLTFTTGTLHVEGDVAPELVTRRVQELGYDVAGETTSPADGEPAESRSGLRGFIRYLLERRNTTLALIGAILIIPGVLFNELLPMLGWQTALWDVMSVLALITAGYPIARSAWRSLMINHEININVLMTIASIGAVIIGAYTEAGLVMVLFALGEALEGYTVEQARDSIRGLMKLAPSRATVLRPCIDCQGHLGRDGYDGGPCPYCGLEEKEVGVSDLLVGDIIIVRPGERIAMDGVLISGASAVDQAAITGESRLVEKRSGDEVFAGSINGEGSLQIEVTHLAEDNTISRMIRMVEEAQARQAPAQRFIDRFARYYTPAVVALAILVAVIPPLLFGQPFIDPANPSEGWLYRALALLVVACPCALVISTPVSLISAISNAAHNGILIKGGVYLETLHKVTAFAFDKTGTLTTGQPALVAVRSVNCSDEISGRCDACDDLLAMASAIERRSEHPLARAVVLASSERGVLSAYEASQAVEAIPGRGISGQIEDISVLIGSHRYFDQHVIHPPDHCIAVRTAAANGQTAMMLSADDTYQGYFTVADTSRNEAAQALVGLKEEGIETVVMLTGDDAATAAVIAGQVGVTEVRANLMPEQKVDAVEALKGDYGAVVMVGDGINDAPALASADVGIAMGAAGTAQAMETADVALMSDDLGKLPFLMRLSHATMRTIYANVALSLGLKAIFLVLIILGYGSLWLAVFADVGASLLVTLNGMRLLKHPSPEQQVPDP